MARPMPHNVTAEICWPEHYSNVRVKNQYVNLTKHKYKSCDLLYRRSYQHSGHTHCTTSCIRCEHVSTSINAKKVSHFIRTTHWKTTTLQHVYSWGPTDITNLHSRHFHMTCYNNNQLFTKAMGKAGISGKACQFVITAIGQKLSQQRTVWCTASRDLNQYGWNNSTSLVEKHGWHSGIVAVCMPSW